MSHLPIENSAQFYAWHHAVKDKDGQRLGQRFFNMYLKDDKQLPGLYEADERTAMVIIDMWLNDHSYHGTFPSPLKGAPHGKCNRTACQQLHADWYNPGTHAYYCARCARDINDACKHHHSWKTILRVY